MKQLNVFGQVVDVIDQDDIDKAIEEGNLHYYLVMRVVDADPDAGSADLRRRRLRTPCEGCGQICWMDPKNFDSMAGMKFMIICAQCMIHKFRTEKPPKH